MHRSRSRSLPLALAALSSLAMLSLTACGSSDDDSTGDEKVNVALLIPNQNDYANSFVAGAEAAAAKDGSAEVRTFVANFNPQTQLTQCQDAIQSQRYQAMVIEPVDGVAMANCAKEAIAAGIKVVAINAPVGADTTTAEPQVDGLTAALLAPPTVVGQHAAEVVVEACADLDPCKVGYLYGTKGFSYDTARRAATDEVFAEHANIQIVAEAESKFDRATTINAVTDMMRAQPDLDVLLSVQDPVPVIAGLESAGALGNVKLFATGASDAAVQTVVDGQTAGMSILMPRTEAERGTEIAIAAVRGTEPTQRSYNTYDDLSPIGSTLTSENASEFPSQFKG
ncbi:sugar ABC transporter substrate-binding protein [Nocardioides sp.]|uniref:sugar ABC transporter substrate-binding protein n=1 Tax=Nocardioides sp. TaxID=35761 RepID=UPI0026223AB4|nr:sugar ABC transporter substrate-binding protein [Nocardioides sp.]MDI6908574.1 sugar ABC transporter substrate-binding protein [Nocardioides sp.]